MANSIIQTDKSKCYLCGRNAHAEYFGLDEHHVYGGYGIRPLSDMYGLKVYLCHDRCHENGKYSVHKNAEVDRALKAKVQKKAMKYYGWSVENFIDIFGQNYL